MSDTNYYYGHGQGALGTINATTGLAAIYDVPLPEIDEMSLALATDKIGHESKRQSIASDDLSVVRKIGMTGKIVCSVHTPDILKLGAYGSSSAVAGGASAATAYASGLVAGDIVAHPGGKTRLTSIVITDSNGSPATLTLGTDYEIYDANAGLIKILNVGSYTQPFKIAATEAAGTSVGFMTQRVYEKSLIFSGLNIADNDKPCIVKLHKIQIEPFSAWSLLSSGNEVNKYEFNFTVLKQTLVAASAALGQYGDYTESAG